MKSGELLKKEYVECLESAMEAVITIIMKPNDVGAITESAREFLNKTHPALVIEVFTEIMEKDEEIRNLNAQVAELKAKLVETDRYTIVRAPDFETQN